MRRVSIIDSHTAASRRASWSAGGRRFGGGPRRGPAECFAADTTASAPPSSTSRAARTCWWARCCGARGPDLRRRGDLLQQCGYLGMCGHGTIGLVVTLAHLGRIGPGNHRIETPVGVVTATLHANGESPWPMCRVAAPRKGVTVKCPGLGTGHRRCRLGRQLVFPRGGHGQDCAGERGPAHRLLPGASARRSTRRASRRWTTSSCSARPRRRAPTRATSCSAPARPTTARPAAPAPAPNWPAWRPTANSPRATWVQESIIGSTFTARFRWLDRRREDRARHHRHGVCQRRSHASAGRAATRFAGAFGGERGI